MRDDGIGSSPHSLLNNQYRKHQMDNAEHKWIYEYDSLTINSNLYYFRCIFSYDKKTANDNNPSMQLVFNIWNDTKKIWIDWNDFKESYLSEKFTDYIKNTINGQRTCYWDNKTERNFR